MDAGRFRGELKRSIDVGQDECGQVHGASEATAVLGLGDLSAHHADGVVATDVFVVPTISFRLVCGLLILRDDARRILRLRLPPRLSETSSRANAARLRFVAWFQAVSRHAEAPQ